MRVIIAGSRSVTEAEVRMALQRCSWIGFASAVVSGTARGADTFGENWANEQQIEIHRYPADWAQYGKRAGPLRNKVMADNAEGLVAVWDGQSRGTHSMIELAQKQGLRVAILRTDSRSFEEITAMGVLAGIWEYAEERAAILEYEAGLSRKQAERQAGTVALQAYSKSKSPDNAR